MKKINFSNWKIAGKRILSLFLDDTIWSVIGTFFGIGCAFGNYFGGNTDKAIFWMVCALVCIMNLKETPKR